LALKIASPAIVPSEVPATYTSNPDLYFQWLAQCSNFVDQLNVMVYDYHGPFDVPKVSRVNAPLTQDTLPNSKNFIKATLTN
jgi:chitinase